VPSSTNRHVGTFGRPSLLSARKCVERKTGEECGTFMAASRKRKSYTGDMRSGRRLKPFVGRLSQIGIDGATLAPHGGEVKRKEPRIISLPLYFSLTDVRADFLALCEPGLCTPPPCRSPVSPPTGLGRNPAYSVIPSENPMILRLPTAHENARSAMECGSEAAALESLAQRRYPSADGYRTPRCLRAGGPPALGP